MCKGNTEYQMAKVAHTINKAYCESIGDFSQRPWADTPKHIQESAIAGVREARANRHFTPEDMHNSWMTYKKSQGWVYGVGKDEYNKTHPCTQPYSELPQDQRVKDYLFLAVVRGMDS